MMRSFFAVALLALFLSGCAESAYWCDRYDDAADIFTATCGVGLGAKTRVGPFHAGLYGGSDVHGLRGGEWGNKINSGGFFAIVFPDIDIEATVLSGEDFSFGEVRHKDFQSRGYPLIAFTTSHDHRTPEFYTQIEAAVGVLGGVRVGANPVELLDFLVGFTAMDIFGDDRGQQRYQDELVRVIEYGDKTRAKQLIAIGADVNFKYRNDYFPLCWTIPYGYNSKNMEMARLLIEAGANVNATTSDGDTMLHLLASSGIEEARAVELAIILIESGAKVNVSNDHGRTALDEARRLKWSEMEKLLLDHEAE